MKLKPIDWFVFLGLLVLAVIVDPTDVFDFGTPILEPMLALGYYLIRKKTGGKD